MIRKRRRRADGSEGAERRTARHADKHHEEQKENALCGHHMESEPSTSTELVQKVSTLNFRDFK